jgi:hypothetical protein
LEKNMTTQETFTTRILPACTISNLIECLQAIRRDYGGFRRVLMVNDAPLLKVSVQRHPLDGEVVVYVTDR